MSASSSSKKRSTAQHWKRALLVLVFPAWLTVAYIAAQLVIGLGISAVLWMHFLTSYNPDDSTTVTVISALVYIVTLAIATGVPYVVMKRTTTMRSLGLTRLPTWGDIGMMLVGAVVYIFLSSILLAIATHFLPFVDPTEAQSVGFRNVSSPSKYLLAFVTLIIVAPIFEETLFRGYLYGNLRKIAPKWLAILVTSALFGVAHMQWNVGIDVFALSIVLCLLREMTGSIVAGILLHMTKNALAFYVLFIASSGLLH